MDKKKLLGQFYTTNYEYILQNLNIPKNVKNIIEPFAGNGELLNFIDKSKYNIDCYDIEPKQNYIKKRDTLLNPPNYKNTFILTNPPYLARNKCKDKNIFNKYQVNDLYKCLIKELLTNICMGGILIIPLNFWSSIRKNDIILRKNFLNKYKILKLNIFEEKVFNDTSYTVCSFQFELNNKFNNKLNIDIFPSKQNIITTLNEKNDYLIGGKIYHLKTKNNYHIYRATKNNINEINSNIVIKCIDDNKDNQIQLFMDNNQEKYIDNTPNLTARSYALLIIQPAINLEKQKILIKKFNKFLSNYRKKYNSLFLTNYRESNNIARKRITFNLVYLILEYLLDKL